MSYQSPDRRGGPQPPQPPPYTPPPPGALPRQPRVHTGPLPIDKPRSTAWQKPVRWAALLVWLALVAAFLVYFYRSATGG